jgi:hypothetical protein
MLSRQISALQISAPLLYSCSLDLTFMVHCRHFCEQSPVIIGVTPASKSSWGFFVNNLFEVPGRGKYELFCFSALESIETNFTAIWRRNYLFK